MADSGTPTKVSVAQGVTLGLALLIGGVVWRAAEKVSDIEDKLEQKFVSKDVFTSEMEAMRREADLRHGELLRRMDTMERKIGEPARAGQ